MSRVRWGRLLASFVVVWLTCLIYFVAVMVHRSNVHSRSDLELDLEDAKLIINQLESDNDNLKDMLKEAKKTRQLLPPTEPKAVQKEVAVTTREPALQYELFRRQTNRDLNEMWGFVRANLESVINDKGTGSDLKAHLAQVISDTQHRHKAALADMHHMSEEDGFESFRNIEAKNLSDLIQRRLHSLQNPKDCHKAKKLLCNLNKGCGYGCQIHHAIYCFIVAYGTERMLVLRSRGWRYDAAGFEDVFLPLSETCPDTKIGSRKRNWPGTKDTEAIELGIVDSVNPKPKFLPPAIPRDLADRMIRLHGNPVIWWISQFLKFMLRPQPDLSHMLKSTEEAQRLEHPIVGIHVRRTDKVGTEAAYHGVDEYMKYVEEYYQELEVKEGQPTKVKRVYVASDDSRVLTECQKNYPDYVFLGDPNISKSAAVSSRYNMKSLHGVIIDIHMLSLSDHLVCTFSSQVCRIAFEIMQTYHADASDHFKSLDDIWYYGGQTEHQQIAIMNHQPQSRDEMELKIGDVIGVAGNHWNGFNKGRNRRTHRLGLYPEYKTKEKYNIVDFPTYPNVKL